MEIISSRYSLFAILSDHPINAHLPPNAPVHLAQGIPESSKYRRISLTQKLSKRLGPCDLVQPVVIGMMYLALIVKAVRSAKVLIKSGSFHTAC